MGYLYQVGATALCPHGGQVTAVAASPRVKVGGAPATVISDQFMIAGCAFNVSGAPQPCLKVQWIQGALRVKIGGQPAVLADSQGICQGAAPQGPPNVAVTQVRVKGM